MPATVIVGTQWGDEGKGKVTDTFAKEMQLVVRYQGGHNAGHTLVVDGERFALRLLPSGVLYDHVTPVIANGVVVDPVTLVEEIDALTARGVDCSRLKVSSHAHLILPWHAAHDALAESRRGEAKLGTTLKGIGPAYADKSRRVGLRVGDMADGRAFAEQLRAAGTAENAMLTGAGIEPIDLDAVVERYAGELAARIRPYVADTVTLLHDALDANQHLLLEGAQATFLDLDHGTYPFVTSSNPTAGGACTGTGLGPRDISRVVGIAKAYTTRVGAGPFPTELSDATGEALVEIGREFGTVTGRRRRTGWLDTVMLRLAARINSLTDLAILKLDVLDSFDEVRLCVAYERDGQRVAGYPDRLADLAAVTPVYETFRGWKTSLAGCHELRDLPPQARDYVEAIAKHVGVPITFVGTGPERDQYVHVA